jgi:hypothetical protein
MSRIHPIPLDHFADVEAEEAVLSHMLFHQKQSDTLEPAHFTSKDRQLIFVAIQEGAPYETIERLDLDLPGYVTDLFFAPAVAPRYLAEMADTLRRLRELRRLRDRLRAWERKASALTLERAKLELAGVLR